jgi:DtxR family Mn-dependent transcriptional regulator
MVKKKILSSSLEDYLEAILNLSNANRVARSKDISESLGVSKASVTGALRLLKQRGLINYNPYDFITLTKTGHQRASEVASRHKIIKSFFEQVLGIESAVAHGAACRAEHSLGNEVITKLMDFSNFVTASTETGDDVAERFRKYCQKNQ